MPSIPRSEEEVKCSYDGCEEEPFRQGLCFQHFLQEQAYLEGTTCEWPEPVLDGGWWGDLVEEVCQ